MNCSIGPKDDGNYYDRFYAYKIKMTFKDEASRDTFLNAVKDVPNIRKKMLNFRNVTEQSLQDTFDLEGERDENKEVYGKENPNEQTMIETITSGTKGDLESMSPDLTATAQKEFPDAGIVNVSIDDARGIDKLCYASFGDPYAFNMQDPQKPDNAAIPAPAAPTVLASNPQAFTR